MKRTLLFSIIASVLTISAYATSATVTSKDYVDAQDALKQNTIPATGTNAATPGDTVVTYTSTAGTIGERGIFDFETDFENGEIVSGHEGDLLTADTIVPAIDDLYRGAANTVVVRNFGGAPVDARGIYDGSTTYNSSTDEDKLITAGAVQNSMSTIGTKTSVCYEWVANAAHTDENCLLWRLVDQNVYGRCNSDSDCVWLDCSNNPNAPYSVCNSDIGQCWCGAGR